MKIFAFLLLLPLMAFAKYEKCENVDLPVPNPCQEGEKCFIQTACLKGKEQLQVQFKCKCANKARGRGNKCGTSCPAGFRFRNNKRFYRCKGRFGDDVFDSSCPVTSKPTSVPTTSPTSVPTSPPTSIPTSVPTNQPTE